MAILTDRTLPLFADQQALIVEGLSEATIEEAVRFLRDWQARADALLDSHDDHEPAGEPKRSLHLSPTLEGRGRLDANLDPEAHAIVRKALSLAQGPYTVGDDAKTPEELRADALVDIARHYLDHQATKTGGRHRPHLNVIVTLQDLIDGGTAHTNETSRWMPPPCGNLACDAGIHRIITDGESSIFDYGRRTTRTIPPAVYTSLVVRDRGCRCPGCDRPADWTEGHHITPWEHGGETNLSNLVLLCSKHHHRIHTKGWHLKLLPTGVVKVTPPRRHHPNAQTPDRAPLRTRSATRRAPPPTTTRSATGAPPRAPTGAACQGRSESGLGVLLPLVTDAVFPGHYTCQAVCSGLVLRSRMWPSTRCSSSLGPVRPQWRLV